MKYKAAHILGWISLCFGIILALVAVLLLFTGEAKAASVFIIPAAALTLAGSNLRAVKKKTP